MKFFAAAVSIVVLAASPADASTARERLVVVCHCSVPAFAEAVEGVREALGRNPELIDLDKMRQNEIESILRRDPDSVYVAIGQDALKRIALLKPEAPVIATMMLSSDDGSRATLEIDLDVPPRLLVQNVHRLFPQTARIGLLASGTFDRGSYVSAAKDLGLQFHIKEVSGPADLQKSLLSLKGKVDLVLTLPDDLLYNSVTVQALILASLEARIPVVGFSAAFVHAGAVAGVFADFKDAGRQAAENALRLDLNHPQHVTDSPRKVSVAINQKIAHLLGLEYERGADFMVLR